MRKTKNSQALISSFFREIVLILGGNFAIDGTDEQTVERVAAGLERAYRRALQKAGPEPRRDSLEPHPAIASLLRLIEMEEGGK